MVRKTYIIDLTDAQVTAFEEELVAMEKTAEQLITDHIVGFTIGRRANALKATRETDRESMTRTHDEETGTLISDMEDSLR